MSAHDPLAPGGQPGPHGSPYGPPPGWVPPPPAHPDARPALIIGIVALGGFFFCLLPIVAAPFAWVKGARAVREIDASGGRLSGRGDARGGMVLGIIGTVLLGLGVLVFVLVLVVVVFLATSTEEIFDGVPGTY